MNEPQQLTAEEVADLIGIKEAARLLPSSRPGKKRHYGTIYRWVRSGRVRGWKLGGGLFVLRRELLAMLRPVKVKEADGRKAAGERRLAARRAEKVLDEAGIY